MVKVVDSFPVKADKVKRKRSSKKAVKKLLKSTVSSPSYTVKVYVTHGYFEYEVGTASQGLEHAGLIMERGVYRRSNERGEVEFYPVIKTKVCGPGLASEYLDVFKRT